MDYSVEGFPRDPELAEGVHCKTLSPTLDSVGGAKSLRRFRTKPLVRTQACTTHPDICAVLSLSSYKMLYAVLGWSMRIVVLLGRYTRLCSCSNSGNVN
eukprot:3803140-Rhodomonas_salina.1